MVKILSVPAVIVVGEKLVKLGATNRELVTLISVRSCKTLSFY